MSLNLCVLCASVIKKIQNLSVSSVPSFSSVRNNPKSKKDGFTDRLIAGKTVPHAAVAPPCHPAL